MMVFRKSFHLVPRGIDVYSQCSFILTVCNPEATRSELQAFVFQPVRVQSLLFLLHAKDTAKATAIVFKLFILSQDCEVIYTVNTENTV